MDGGREFGSIKRRWRAKIVSRYHIVEAFLLPVAKNAKHLFENVLTISNNVVSLYQQISKTMTLHVDTMTKEDLKKAIEIEPSLGKMFSDIDNTDIETLRTKTEWWFKLNTQVGAHYDKFGF